MKLGYRPLFEANEYVHDLSDKDLRGLIVSQTGLDGTSSTVGAILGSFKALRAFAQDTTLATQIQIEGELPPLDTSPRDDSPALNRFSIGYTINLNLPATYDIAVFNAIFKSIREHLMR